MPAEGKKTDDRELRRRQNANKKQNDEPPNENSHTNLMYAKITAEHVTVKKTMKKEVNVPAVENKDIDVNQGEEKHEDEINDEKKDME